MTNFGGMIYTCSNCGNTVRTSCKEYHCPRCNYLIVAVGDLTEDDKHKGKKWQPKSPSTKV